MDESSGVPVVTPVARLDSYDSDQINAECI